MDVDLVTVEPLYPNFRWGVDFTLSHLCPSNRPPSSRCTFLHELLVNDVHGVLDQDCPFDRRSDQSCSVVTIPIAVFLRGHVYVAITFGICML